VHYPSTRQVLFLPGCGECAAIVKEFGIEGVRCGFPEAEIHVLEGED
jgi:hypothetical protein